MSSFRTGGIPGVICPTCSRSHFPFCGRAPSIHPPILPPYAQGRSPLHQHLPISNLNSTPLLGHPFNRPLSPPRHILGHFPGRQEGFLEGGGHAFHGPHHSALPGHPLPSFHDGRSVDRFGDSSGCPPGDRMGLAGGHVSRLPMDGRNAAGRWIAEEERQRDIASESEREMLPRWFLDQMDKHGKGLGQPVDRFGAIGARFDRHSVDLLSKSLPGLEPRNIYLNGTGEDPELRRRCDGVAHREDNQIYKGLRRGNDVMGGGVHEMSDQVYKGMHEGYDGMKRGMHERGALDYGIMPGVFKGGQQPAARFEGFEPTQGGFQGVSASFKHPMGESTMSGTTGAAEFGNVYKEGNDNAGSRDDDPGLRRGNEYRDFLALNLGSLLRVQKRARMEGVEDVHGPEKGRLVGNAMEKGDFFRGQNESTDHRFFGSDGSLRPSFSEYQQEMQYSNRILKDKESCAAFGGDQMVTGGVLGMKRQWAMSREEELLIEHGLLHDDMNSPEIDPVKFDSSFGEGKPLPPDGSQGLGLPLPGKLNNDGISPAQKAVVGQKFQIGEDKGTHHWNMHERYLAIQDQNILHDCSFMEGGEHNRNMPVYTQSSQKDLVQGRSMASAQSVWQGKVDDSHAFNQSLVVSQATGTFQATRDGSHLPMQQLTGTSTPPSGDRVGLPESSGLKRGGFEEHHFPGQLRPDESLRTVREPHLDFLQHQQEPMVHKHYQFQQVNVQEQRFRPDAQDSFRTSQEQQKNLFPQVQWQQQQAVSRNEGEIPMQNSEHSSRGQITYTQIQHLQSTQAGEQNVVQDGIENTPSGGQSFSGPYGDRLHRGNLQPHHPWPQPLQHVSTHPDMSFQKNRYGPAEPAVHVQKHDPFQHPPPHEVLQNQHLQLHDQQQHGQQRQHQQEQQISKIHVDGSQLQKCEPHYQLPQSASAIYPNQYPQKLQIQQVSSQISNEQFQPQEWQHCQASPQIYEKQKPQEWGSHLQQQTNQEAGQHNEKLNHPMQQQQQMIQIQSFDVRTAHHQPQNERVNFPMAQQQQMIPCHQQPSELYQQQHRHHQQPQVQANQLQAQQNTQGGYQLSNAGHFEIPHLNAQGGYQLSNGRVELPGMQMTTTVTNGQPTQASDFTPFAPPLPPLPPPPSPPSSPPHAPPPPPSLPPASPSKSSAPPSFSAAAAGTHSLPTAMRSFPEVKPSTHGYQFQQPPGHHGTGLSSVASQLMHHSPFKGQHFPPKQTQEEKTKVVDAVHIFRQPGRATRPDRFVIILRGLPGSGKSYLAKALRDVEVMNGGSAPRIHSMDDYFMAEVEKVEDSDTGNSSSLILRAKKRVTKKVMEYCYEPEMEEAYRASMLKAFKKTLEEGIFTFIIVDDRNLRVADFAQFWAIAKRSGYEVYLLEAPYKDPAGCAARNVHSFTADQVQEMAGRWESAPALYLQLDISSLFHGDNLDAQNITEVEMDTDEVEHDQDENFRTESGMNESPLESSMHDGMSNCGDRWDSDKPSTQDEAKDLAKSKWSDDHDEDSTSPRECDTGTCNALSGLMQAYGKGDRCVHWADQGGKDGDKGFSIGCAPKNKRSLIIGPGAGYNEASNPITDEEREIPEHESHAGWESKRNTLFLEQLRAEQESFRAVFDRRRHRIGGMDEDDD